MVHAADPSVVFSRATRPLWVGVVLTLACATNVGYSATGKSSSTSAAIEATVPGTSQDGRETIEFLGFAAHELVHDGQETQPQLSEDDPILSVRPSILSGRQYLVGERYVAMTGPICATCSQDGEGNLDCTYHPIEMETSLEEASLFGGHDALAHSPKPVGKLSWKGQSVGDVAGPVSGGPTELDFIYSPEDQETGETLRITFPEAASEVTLRMRYRCPYLSGEEEFEWVIPFRVEMGPSLSDSLDLIRIDDTTLSDNGKARLVIERSTHPYFNSHRNSAGYASADTQNALEELISSYGQCPVNANLPPQEKAMLLVTAISLPHGGIYDVNLNWDSFNGGHKNHRAGEDVDIGLISSGIHQDKERLRCLYDSIVAPGTDFHMPVSVEALVVINEETGEVEATGNHVHLWNGEETIYPKDMSCEDDFIWCLLQGGEP